MDKSYFKNYKAEYAKTHKKVEIYLPLEEYNEFKKITKELGHGNKVGRAVKEFAINYRQNRYTYPPELKEKLEENTFLLRNIANNINQIAHYSNTVKEVIEHNKIFEELRKVEEVIKDFANDQMSKKWLSNQCLEKPPLLVSS